MLAFRWGWQINVILASALQIKSSPCNIAYDNILLILRSYKSHEGHAKMQRITQQDWVVSETLNFLMSLKVMSTDYSMRRKAVLSHGNANYSLNIAEY
jgi:hypothetical protein